jgi:hypothetical protein
LPYRLAGALVGLAAAASAATADPPLTITC